MNRKEPIILNNLEQITEDLYNMLYIPDYKILIHINREYVDSIRNEICNYLPKSFIHHIDGTGDKIVLKNGSTIIITTDIRHIMGMRFVNVYYEQFSTTIDKIPILENAIYYNPFDRLQKLLEEENPTTENSLEVEKQKKDNL